MRFPQRRRDTTQGRKQRRSLTTIGECRTSAIGRFLTSFWVSYFILEDRIAWKGRFATMAFNSKAPESEMKRGQRGGAGNSESGFLRSHHYVTSFDSCTPDKVEQPRRAKGIERNNTQRESSRRHSPRVFETDHVATWPTWCCRGAT